VTTRTESAVASKVPNLFFEDFFRGEYERLGAALYLLTGDRLEAEDLAQDAMSRIFERWERVASMDSPVGYLYRTAMNLWRKRLRRLSRRPPERPAVAVAGPSDVAERRARIREALASLSTDQRAAVVLVEWVGLSAAEVGELLGISAESVRGRVHRARVALRDRFGGSDE
jgi:RNA polymerase sigma-70 factor, ECF subfamily